MLYCLCCTLILHGRVDGWAEVPTILLILFFQHKLKKGVDVISPKFRWNLTDIFRTKDTNMANQVYLSLLSTLDIACLMQPHIHSHVQGSLEPVRHTLSHRSRGFALVTCVCVSVCGCEWRHCGLISTGTQFYLSPPVSHSARLHALSVCEQMPVPCCHSQDSLILGHVFTDTRTHAQNEHSWLTSAPCV